MKPVSMSARGIATVLQGHRELSHTEGVYGVHVHACMHTTCTAVAATGTALRFREGRGQFCHVYGALVTLLFVNSSGVTSQPALWRLQMGTCVAWHQFVLISASCSGGRC